MFDIGFSELLLTAAVALLVLGPDKLPQAARTAGLVIGKLKRSFSEFRREIEREIGTDDLRNQMAANQLTDLGKQLRSQLDPQAKPIEHVSGSPQALPDNLEPGTPSILQTLEKLEKLTPVEPLAEPTTPPTTTPHEASTPDANRQP